MIISKEIGCHNGKNSKTKVLFHRFGLNRYFTHMSYSLVIFLAVGLASLGPALKFSATVLVPAKLDWKNSFSATALVAVIAIPLTTSWITVGLQSMNWWQTSVWFAAAFWLPIGVSGGYLHAKVLASDGRQLGWRRANELSMFALCIALTASIALLGVIESGQSR